MRVCWAEIVQAQQSGLEASECLASASCMLHHVALVPSPATPSVQRANHCAFRISLAPASARVQQNLDSVHHGEAQYSMRAASVVSQATLRPLFHFVWGSC